MPVLLDFTNHSRTIIIFCLIFETLISVTPARINQLFWNNGYKEQKLESSPKLVKRRINQHLTAYPSFSCTSLPGNHDISQALRHPSDQDFEGAFIEFEFHYGCDFFLGFVEIN